MNQFTIRVEIHMATEQNYLNLHTEMERRKCTRFIQNDNDGIWYQLPNAEYCYNGYLDINEVLRLAQEALSIIGVSGEILVTQAVNTSWAGLHRAR